jgi:AcrR family transcriptional regulator
MHHVKADLRAQKSAHRLYGALMDAVGEQPLEAVRVSDLCQRCGVGRTTFYRNFDEVVDILRWQCDRQFRESWEASFQPAASDGSKSKDEAPGGPDAADAAKEGSDAEGPDTTGTGGAAVGSDAGRPGWRNGTGRMGFLTSSLGYWVQDDHAQVLEVLMNARRVDVIFESFLDNAHIMIDGLVAAGINLAVIDIDLLLPVRAGYFIGIMSYWIGSGKRDDAATLARKLDVQENLVRDSALIF